MEIKKSGSSSQNGLGME